MNQCLVADPVPAWQRALWNYAFLGRIVRGKMKQMMSINAENVRYFFSPSCRRLPLRSIYAAR
jgi:hypothetical protein